MITLDAPEAHGHTTFCDDIRYETSGKAIFIGVYLGTMNVHGNFPFVLPKFCFAIRYSQRSDKLISPVKIVIFLPGDADEKPSIEGEVSEDALQDQLRHAEKTPDLGEPKPFTTLNANFALNNLTIPSRGLIKVRAVRNDTLVRLGTLAVVHTPRNPSATAAE